MHVRPVYSAWIVAALAAVTTLPAEAQSQLQAPTNKVDEAQISQIVPPAAAPAPTQIMPVQPATPSQTQIAPVQPPAKPAVAAKVAQLAPGGTTGAAKATVASVHGTDRCDPAVGTASEKANCEQMLQSEADNAPDTSSAPVAAPVDTTSNASSLVNGILNGGTGTVVAIPGK